MHMSGNSGQLLRHMRVKACEEGSDMSILDKVQDTFARYPKGVRLSRSEIVELVYAKHGITKGSIIPSDYCYNLVNKDKLSNRSLLDFNIFEWIDSKTYIYVGRNQKYTGPIFHKIDLKLEKVGVWENGVRTLYPDPIRKTPEQTISRVLPFFPVQPPKSTRDNTLPAPFSGTNGKIADQLQVSRLWNYGTRSDWEHAIDDYWGAVKPGNMRLEEEIEDLDAEQIRRINVYEFYAFLHDKFFIWKYTAPNRLATTRRSLERYMLENTMDQLAYIHRCLFTFDRNDIKNGLEIVKQIQGLGASGSSGLLAVLFPNDFGTADQFVVKAMCELDGLPEREHLVRMNPESLTIQDGVLVISILRRKAKELNQAFGTNSWTPRMVDKVLWSIGRV